jgi:predicted RNA-binding protein YlxR (DUF448 family)
VVVAAPPVRTCVGCKVVTAKSDLIRLVVIVEGAERRVVPDPRGQRLGRGAHLHPELSCLELAERRRAFPRAFRLDGPLDARNVRSYLEAPDRLS